MHARPKDKSASHKLIPFKYTNNQNENLIIGFIIDYEELKQKCNAKHQKYQRTRIRKTTSTNLSMDEKSHILENTHIILVKRMSL